MAEHAQQNALKEGIVAQLTIVMSAYNAFHLDVKGAQKMTIIVMAYQMIKKSKRKILMEMK